MENIFNDENILSPEEIDDLFVDNTVESDEEDTTIEQTNENVNNNNLDTEKPVEKDLKTTEINPEELFSQGKSESVGSEKNSEENQEEGDNQSKEGNGSSPKENFYSSIANAFKKDGILPTLDSETIKKIETPEDFALAYKEHIQKEVEAKFEEEQLRIKQALDSGVQPDLIQKFEGTIKQFDSITDDQINDESQGGENLRKQIIFQDYINRGYSKERAVREVKKSFAAGTDLEDAKYSLDANKEFFKSQYNTILEEAKKAEQEAIKQRETKAKELKKSILEEEEIFEGVKLDTNTRKKIYDTITKPIAQTEDGVPINALQKFARENPNEFFKKLGTVFVLTDGLKNLNKLVEKNTKKQLKSELREVEHVLKNTNLASDGSLELVTGVNIDDNANISSDWQLDVEEPKGFFG